MLECGSCKAMFKADTLISEHYPDVASEVTVDALDTQALDELVNNHNVACPDCQGAFKGSYEFNLMFKTVIGREVSPPAGKHSPITRYRCRK